MFQHGALPIVYGVVALLSVLLLLSYFLFSKKKNPLFLGLFGCVALSNSGYFLMSICRSLPVAKVANAVSYFGGAFAMLVMVFIIYDVCQIRRKKWMNGCFIGVSTAIFMLAASADWLGLYYRSVSLGEVNGITVLIKDYGPLHSLYAVYLAAYVVIMLAGIIYSAKIKRLASVKYTLFLLVSVLLNVAVWLVEQSIEDEFEFLSVSYIITAVLLLIIYNMLSDYGVIRPDGQMVSVQMLTRLNTQQITPGSLPPDMEEMFDSFSDRAKILTPAERRILTHYIEGYDIADIPDLLFVSIHTVKKHNRSIYQKLEVASKDELMLYIELFRCCGRLDELTDGEIYQK